MSNIMFPKPKKKPKEPYRGLKTNKPLQPKTRLKQNIPIKIKNKGFKNKPIEPNTPCELNFSGCTGMAIETHELTGGHKARKNSGEIKFQKKTCRSCHRYWEEKVSKNEKNHIRAVEQLRIMAETGMTEDEFRNHIGMSYL